MATTFLRTLNLSAQELERDPFISILDLKKQKSAAYKTKIDLPKVILKGIIWNKKQPVAIINDDLVMVGDDWQGYKLERIDRDSVLLSDGANTYKLSVTEDMPNLGKDSLTAKPEEPLEDEMRKQQEGIMPPEMQGMYPDKGYSLEQGINPTGEYK